MLTDKIVYAGGKAGLRDHPFLAYERGADHPETGETLSRAQETVTRVATYQRERRAILTDTQRSDRAQREALTTEAQAVETWIEDRQRLFLKVARTTAAEMEYKLVSAGQAVDAAQVARRVELRARFEKRTPEQQTDVLRKAVGRHSEADLELLHALFEDGDIMSLISEGIRERIAQAVLELADPKAWFQFSRLSRQLDQFESFIEAASRYVRSDVGLSATQRAEQSKEEEYRRRLAVRAGERV
jgi:hypothetical protein